MKKLNSLFLLILFIATLLTGCAGHSNEVSRIASEIYAKSNIQKPIPPHVFESDGCSCFPDGEWVECCIKHDVSYWKGGSREERSNADAELRKCVSDKGYPLIARLMYYGVRAGGVWWLPTSFRWGFGWNYPQSGPTNEPY